MPAGTRSAGVIDVEAPLWLENRECRVPVSTNQHKALQGTTGGWSRPAPIFDDERWISCPGLVPVMGLAEQTALLELIADRVVFEPSKVASNGAKPDREGVGDHRRDGGGADCIDDLDLPRTVAATAVRQS